MMMEDGVLTIFIIISYYDMAIPTDETTSFM